ncbi:MAG: hypothetical protein OQL09_09990 [Gammaproteobacteria bacterium]|nr:hypothetical protein [Gammaproteobacteria bacterium]
MAEILSVEDRTQAGPTAPADGLYLVKVTYPEQYDFPAKINLPEFMA